MLPVLVTAAALAVGCDQPDPIRPTPNIEPLTISCPSGVTLQAERGQTAMTVTYAAPGVTGGVLPIQTQCSPQSGSSFQVGTTPVQCSATDGRATVATCGFSVVVQPPPAPPRLSATTFMAFGDSLTEGKVTLAPIPWALVQGPAYTLKLESLLRLRYSDQTITVINEGLGGERAIDAVPRLDRTLDQYRPTVLLLMHGANDLPEGLSGVTQAIGAIDTMITHALARGVKVFLATLPPQAPNRQRSAGEPYVVPLNDRIKQLAPSRPVTFVDVYDAFHGDLSLVGPDGLHLTEAGYDVVARAFYDRIVAALETPTTVSRR